MRPLEGVTVVSLEQAVAAPFASRQLGDWGARVIKIERPGEGDFARRYDGTVRGLSSYFVWLNRGKESLALDLKSRFGLGVMSRLLERADVLLENLGPGAVERLGLGDAELRGRHPRLIVCHVSGYGRSGPYRDRKAYDLLVQCETGMASLTGTPDEAVKVGTPVADIAAGMYALVGILLALRQRDATGAGTVVDVSMLDSLGEWLGHALYFARFGGADPPRAGLHHATIAPYGPYAAADGDIFVAVQNEREWRRLCADVLGRPGLADDPRFIDNPRRVAHRTELDAALRPLFAVLRGDELRRRLDAAGIARADLNTAAAFADHAQLMERQRWRSVDTPAGEVAALLPPVSLSGVSPAMGSVPALNAHAEAILSELGLPSPGVARGPDGTG